MNVPNPLGGIFSLLDSAKGNAFIMCVIALLWAKEGVEPWLVAVCITALGVAFMVTRAFSDWAALKHPPPPAPKP